MICTLAPATILCLLLATGHSAAAPHCTDCESGHACRKMLAVARNNAFRSRADTNDIRTIQWPALLRKEGQPKLEALAAELEADLAHDD